MEPPDPQVRTPALARGVVVVSLVLVVYHLALLVPTWQAWQAGAPDRYPDEHRRALLGTVSGLAIALAVPIPLLMMRIGRERRALRAAMWGGWAVCMAVSVYTFWLRR